MSCKAATEHTHTHTHTHARTHVGRPQLLLLSFVLLFIYLIIYFVCVCVPTNFLEHQYFISVLKDCNCVNVIKSDICSLIAL